jgi:hypothetical protein
MQMFAVDIAELATGTDSAGSGFTFFTLVEESATITEETTPILALLSGITETATILDAVSSAGSVFAVRVNESGRITDIAPVPTGVFNVSVIESLIATDVFFARLFWEPINVNQTPGWTEIVDVQNPNWTEITTV